MVSSVEGVTQLLVAWGRGDCRAADDLFALVYEELHRLAERLMRRERPGHTLQATALVNEAYLQLSDQQRVVWQNRAHFFGIAAQLMRRILIRHAERHNRIKRGAGLPALELDESFAITEQRASDLISLDRALAELSELDPRQSRIVEMRFFAGLSVGEISAALDISPATVKREWRIAKAWLYGAVNGHLDDRSAASDQHLLRDV